jgi:ABC-type nitrate/sulfonate/bicarbonate transport system permease component
LCFAHLSSWTISAAATGEEITTASAIPTIQSLGIVFGVAWAGVVANAAGLGAGVSPATVAAVATWVYSLSFIAPLALLVLAVRVVLLHRRQGVSVPDVSMAS